MITVGSRVRYCGRMKMLEGWTGIVTRALQPIMLGNVVFIGASYSVNWDNGDCGERLRDNEIELIQESENP